MKISEISITIVKPKNGLVAFTSFVLDDAIYLGSIAIMTRPQGGYRLVYPSKKVGERNLNIFFPLNRDFSKFIDESVMNQYQKLIGTKNGSVGTKQ